MNQYLNGPQPPYPNQQGMPPQQPYQQPGQPARELMRVKCQFGHIVITETVVRVESKRLSTGKGERSISRSMLTGVHLRVSPRFLWIGRKYADLVFYAQGVEMAIARIVWEKQAREIVALLGY